MSAKDTRVYTLIPTIDKVGAYAASDRLGSAMTITGALNDPGGPGMIMSINIVDEAKQSAAMTCHFFNALPSLTSADNAALDITGLEMRTKYLGSVAIGTSDYVALASCSVASVNGIGLAFRGATSSSDIYALLQSQTNPTYNTITALTVIFAIAQG